MASRNRCPVVLVAAALAALATAPAGAAPEPATTRVSVSTNGIQSVGGDAGTAAISANGGFVAFDSPATNLVPGDTNAAPDVFVRDLAAGVTTRVSVNSVGRQATGGSGEPAISADGRFVAFDSGAEDLVTGDNNTKHDVFIHDRQSGQTTRVSVGLDGLQANGDSGSAALSADGRVVAFISTATNLVAGDGNGFLDVFVHDRSTGKTTRVSVDSGGVQATNVSVQPALSADGRVVAFASAANNLVPGDGNGKVDVFVHNLVTGETRRVSGGTGAAEANSDSVRPSLNSDGSAVAYLSGATNLVPGDTNAFPDVFVTRASRTVRVSLGAKGVQGNNNCEEARISDDGLSVAFTSASSNLVPNDTNGAVDVFVARGGRSVRINLGPADVEANHNSSGPSISANGSVAFPSDATNLVDHDTNAATDIFVSVPRRTHQGVNLFP